MKNKTIVLAYSGGLDTSFCLKRLSIDGFDVHAILVNTGGFNKSELINIKKQAIELGASKFISIDAKKPFYDKLIKFLIFGKGNLPPYISAAKLLPDFLVIPGIKFIAGDPMKPATKTLLGRS